MNQADSATNSYSVDPADVILDGHQGMVIAVAFHPTLDLLASASDDRTIKIWQYDIGALQRTVLGHIGSVNDLDFNSKGTLLVSCSSDRTIRIWDVGNGWADTNTFVGHEHTVSSVRFMPGDQQIVSGSRDGTVRIWDVASAAELRTVIANAGWIRCVRPSYDGQAILSSSDQVARLSDARTGQTLVEFVGHDLVVEAAAFAPVAAYPAIRELAGHISEAGGPERPGRYMATASRDKCIKIWDYQSGQAIGTLVGHCYWVQALVFHPSGKYLLSASDDYTIRVWELRTGRCVRTVEAHPHFVSCLALNPRSARSRSLVASGGPDMTVKVWDEEAWIQEASARL
ncbi:WD40-repeat-containing domain protein [Fomitopsis serialis]|uniref:WD40-repeat-containing domain protein n=1 Tax=Fomitopsis serialis TaxID=139415 RepID=UPI002008B7F2|nr:WD40-repeat-containing domain protein [Neoantrodia serialis]KAH9930583.1 WD40-repeat-containing domain protein [Neoantrodia serialis]